MKKLITCAFVALLFLNVHAQKNILISNTLPVQREEVVEIPWQTITTAYPSLDTAGFKVIDAKTKKEYTWQLEFKGSEQVQNLLVQVTVPANGSIALQLVKGKHMAFTAKTYCRFVPERKDDFAWENDRIAFRMYGKALESTPAEMAYGVDVWVKRTDKLVLNDRYKRGEYHIDHGDGMDYYHVGLTLGAGGIAPYTGDTIGYSKNFRTWKVLDNGPLRSTFQLGYEEWMVAGKKISCVKTISLDAGSQLNKTTVQFTTATQLPVVVGIIKRNEPGTMQLDEKENILSYWEPQHGADGTTGVACILTTPVQQMMVKQGQLLAQTKTGASGIITYYNGAAWDKAGMITTAKSWQEYLYAFQTSLKTPLSITVK